MIRQEQLDRLDEIIRRARAAGYTEVAAKAVDLLARALRQIALDTYEADPMSRARARVTRAREADEPADGLHKLRKGRDRCTATRRDGEPCQAPAVEGGLVCRRHGGAAPQVQIAVKHQQLRMALYSANRDFEEVREHPASSTPSAAGPGPSASSTPTR